MKTSLKDYFAGARRILPAVAILAVVAAGVVALSRLGE